MPGLWIASVTFFVYCIMVPKPKLWLAGVLACVAWASVAAQVWAALLAACVYGATAAAPELWIAVLVVCIGWASVAAPFWVAMVVGCICGALIAAPELGGAVAQRCVGRAGMLHHVNGGFEWLCGQLTRLCDDFTADAAGAGGWAGRQPTCSCSMFHLGWIGANCCRIMVPLRYLWQYTVGQWGMVLESLGENRRKVLAAAAGGACIGVAAIVVPKPVAAAAAACMYEISRVTLLTREDVMYGTVAVLQAIAEALYLPLMHSMLMHRLHRFYRRLCAISTCDMCHETFPEDDMLHCPNDHHMCSTCTAMYTQHTITPNVLTDFNAQVPCPSCNVHGLNEQVHAWRALDVVRVLPAGAAEAFMGMVDDVNFAIRQREADAARAAEQARLATLNAAERTHYEVCNAIATACTTECPRCGVGYVLEDGCNAVKCENCGTHSCRLCGTAHDGSGGAHGCVIQCSREITGAADYYPSPATNKAMLIRRIAAALAGYEPQVQQRALLSQRALLEDPDRNAWDLGALAARGVSVPEDGGEAAGEWDDDWLDL